MTVRLSSIQFYQKNVGELTGLQAKLIDLQRQLSSGNRVEKPSDDPARVFEGLTAERSIQEFDQFNRNILFAQNEVDQLENGLTDITDSLVTARDLILGSMKGTNSQGDLEAIALSLENVMSQIMSTANRQNIDGNFIFSGKAEDTPAFGPDLTYQGEKRQPGVSPGRSIEISKGVFVDLGVTAQDSLVLSEAGTDSNGVPFEERNVLNVLKDAIDLLRSGNALANTQEMNYYRSEVIAIFDKVQTSRSGLGIRQQTLESTQISNSSLRDGFEKVKQDAFGADIAAAISQLVQGQTQLEAMQLTYSNISKLSLFEFVA